MIKTLFNHSFLSVLFVFAIGIILSCQSKYEQCEVNQQNEQVALYNDILTQIVEEHLYHRYLGNDFTNYATGTTDYTYSSDRSLISDANKGISLIEYNYLKLPKRIDIQK